MLHGRLWYEFLRLLIGVALMGAVLELMAAASGLPGTVMIFRGLLTLWQTGVLVHDIQVTLARCLVGWSIGAALGVVLD